MWLELIDKKNNHKTNIFVFSFFLKKKKNISLYMVSNLTELLSCWKRTKQMLLEEALWLDHEQNMEAARPGNWGGGGSRGAKGAGGKHGCLPALGGPLGVACFPREPAGGAVRVWRAQWRQRTKQKEPTWGNHETASF